VSFTFTVVPPWQNLGEALDVNNDTYLTPVDALQVINEINRHGSRPLPRPSGSFAPPPYYDVNGDEYVSPIDALKVINHLNRVEGEGEADIRAGSAMPAATWWGRVANNQATEFHLRGSLGDECSTGLRGDESRAPSSFLQSLDLLYAQLNGVGHTETWEPAAPDRDVLANDLEEFLAGLLALSADDDVGSASGVSARDRHRVSVLCRTLL
jgi:hypothetical protein